MRESHAAVGTAPLSARELRPLCEDEVAKLCRNFTEISLAVLVTDDTRLVTCQSTLPRNDIRIASMASALLISCENLAHELSGGACQSVLVSMHDYTCVIVHVRGLHQSLVLAIGVGQDVMLALARRLALDLADRLALRLQAAEADNRPMAAAS